MVETCDILILKLSVLVKRVIYTILLLCWGLTLMGHFVSSPREREKKDRRDSRGDERKGLGRKRNRNESEQKK